MAVMFPRLLGAVVGLAVAGMAATASGATLYATQSDSLYTIDPITAVGTLVGDAGTGGPINGLTSVAPIPLPAAFPLFATALAGMGLLGWRRKRKASASV